MQTDWFGVKHRKEGENYKNDISRNGSQIVYTLYYIYDLKIVFGKYLKKQQKGLPKYHVRTYQSRKINRLYKKDYLTIFHKNKGQRKTRKDGIS